jgi:hypothetical protein
MLPVSLPPVFFACAPAPGLAAPRSAVQTALDAIRGRAGRRAAAAGALPPAASGPAAPSFRARPAPGRASLSASARPRHPLAAQTIARRPPRRSVSCPELAAPRASSSGGGGGASPRARDAAPPPRALLLSASAALAAASLNESVGRIVQGMEQELVLESVLHAPLGAPMLCLAHYSVDEESLAPAPPPRAGEAAPAEAEAPHPSSAAGAAGGGAKLARMPSAAACLASPVEPTEQEVGLGTTARAALTRLRAPAPLEAPTTPIQLVRAAAVAAEVGRDEAAAGLDVCPVELWQRQTALVEAAELAAEQARRSAPVRRARRRALVRAARGARDGAAGLLGAVGLNAIKLRAAGPA